jgi:hypothetical protein
VAAVADQIKVDSTQLKEAASTLKHDASVMQDYLYQIFNAMKPHDPTGGGGDEVGKAIGEQYFTNANQLLHASGVAALLLIDIANLAATGADDAAKIELYLEQINRDLSVGDAKLPPPITAPDGSNPSDNPIHPRR